MSLSKSSFLLMVGRGQESGIEFSFTESLHMQLMEDKSVWISQDEFCLKHVLVPLYCKKRETTFDDAFVIAAVWAKVMIYDDYSFMNFICNDSLKRHGQMGNKFAKEIYRQAKEIIKDLTPALKFVAVSLYDSDHEFLNITFLKKAKEYGINYEFCKTSVKSCPNNFKEIALPNKLKCEMLNIQYTNWGSLGLKTGDKICFIPSGKFYESGSGDDSTDKSSLIFHPDNQPGYFSIRCLTRRLLNGELPKDLDIYQLWSYQGKTFREIYEEKVRGWGVIPKKD